MADPTERSERVLRLAAVRRRMAAAGLDVLVVRGTDRYLSEYVPLEESLRAWLTGFTGSVGDALVTADGAWLFVDARYWIQAEREVDRALWDVVRVPFGSSNERAVQGRLAGLRTAGGVRLGYEPGRYPAAEAEALEAGARSAGLEPVPLAVSPVEEARGPVRPRLGRLRPVPTDIAGRTTAEKLRGVREALERLGLEAVVLPALDEIAWLTNLRGDELAEQSTFRARAVVRRDGWALALPAPERAAPLHWEEPPALLDEADWTRGLPPGAARVGCDRSTCTAEVLRAVAAAGATPVATESPVRRAKAVKHPAELAHLRAALRRADAVFAGVERWVHRRADAGDPASEADLAREVERRFLRSGALGRAFRTIAAAGPHGAIVHHSEPDPSARLEAGTLVLLDAGAFYAGGYATDLTRTFLAGRRALPRPAWRDAYTAVLRGALAALAARLPVGATGCQLDALTRGPLWRAGIHYQHGTGHGVGIAVHEAPPRISQVGHEPLEPGQVFSIEPGAYVEGEFGVRIENLATLIPDPQRDGFLRVVPLTFAPLDPRLIDRRALTTAERSFLRWYRAASRRSAEAPLEPFPLG